MFLVKTPAFNDNFLYILVKSHISHDFLFIFILLPISTTFLSMKKSIEHQQPFGLNAKERSVNFEANPQQKSRSE